MQIKYFKFLDYTSATKYTWQECGMNYDKENVEMLINHPEWFVEHSSPVILEFPAQPVKFAVTGYSEVEITYIESKLNYKFPRAFKEILYLCGEIFFMSMISSSFPHHSKKEESNLEWTIRNLIKFQTFFKLRYRKIEKKDCPLDFFMIYHHNDWDLSIAISNKSDDTTTFFLEPSGLHKYSDSSFYSYNNSSFITFYQTSLITRYVRETLEGYTLYHTSIQSTKLLNKAFQKKSLFNNLILTETNHGLRIENEQINISVFVLIQYNDIPDFYYNNYSRQYKLKETIIFTYNFREIVDKREEIVKKIISRLKKINFFD